MLVTKSLCANSVAWRYALPQKVSPVYMCACHERTDRGFCADMTHSLQHCRPAAISHLSSPMGHETALRNWWLVNMGLQLPANIPYIVHIRLDDDCDAPTLPYPSCCILTPGGLSYIPHKLGSASQAEAMRTITGASRFVRIAGWGRA